MVRTMAEEIWVLAEQWRGRISEATFEVLALGREVADALGAGLQAVLLGHGMANLAGALGAADAVLSVDHAALAEPSPEVCAQVLAHLIRERQPRGLMIPMTNVSMETGSLVAAHLHLPFVNFCTDVRVTDGRLQARCLLYAGKIEATVAPAATPAIFGVLPGSRSPEEGLAERTPAVVDISLDLPEAPLAQFRGYIEPEAGGVDITQQDILVSVGRGIQRQENVGLAEDLAHALGGAVCGSRPVIDQGWLPLSRQVGRSGMLVKPRLYLALGISGAPEHVEGMKNSGLIIAINSDLAAPIFSVAHVGVAADLFDVVPLLVERVKALKGRQAA